MNTKGSNGWFDHALAGLTILCGGLGIVFLMLACATHPMAVRSSWVWLQDTNFVSHAPTTSPITHLGDLYCLDQDGHLIEVCIHHWQVPTVRTNELGQCWPTSVATPTAK